MNQVEKIQALKNNNIVQFVDDSWKHIDEILKKNKNYLV